jgi:thiamine-phosphate pyrophosphorylase
MQAAQKRLLVLVGRDHRRTKIPWVAIGGITLENLDEVLGAGAQRVCVVSAILNTPDLTATCRRFKARLKRQ